ncbi:MAG TPA: ribonuclease HII [Solirubrobacterales bacterium]|nr:ribonuclease HII [Solirubrobacterales bacterium]
MPTKPKSLIDFDLAFGRSVAGADEAGRGCLAGPIVAAGVRFDYDKLSDRQIEMIGELNDSKKFDSERREELLVIVTECASSVALVVRSAPYIDAFGLHKTNLHCLGTALSRVHRPECTLLSDGYMPFGLREPCEPIVKGDATSAAIAAASIVAKVTRDRFMRRISADHPGWGFEQHVGYSTKPHRDAIVELGMSPLHRRSFASSAYEQLELVA